MAFASIALPAEVAGQATVIDGDVEIHGTRIRLTGSTRPKVRSSAGVMTVYSTDAEQRRPTLSPILSHDGPSVVCQ